MEPQHLGDGAYIEWIGYAFVLYTSNGIERTNEVYLELDAMKRLIEFARAKRLKVSLADV